jgi:ferrous iron transport protein A
MPDDLPAPTAAPPTARSDPPVTDPLTLADLPLNVPARVVAVRPAGATQESRELALRLLEIGFMDGERVRVIAQGHPGREPVAVRIGGTTFALRRFEAEQVLVEVDSADPLADPSP